MNMKNSMIKRIFCAVLCASAMLGTGCQETGTETNAETVASVTETETVSATPNWDAVEKPDLGGMSIDIIQPPASTTWYDALDVEEITGDQLNDAIYNRNRYMEQQLNLTMNVSKETTPATKMTSTTLAGTGDYDLCLDLIQQYGGGLLSKGLIRSYNTIDTIDLSKPWWCEASLDTLTINGHYFFGILDFSVDFYESLAVLYYNGELLTEYQLEDPYVLFQNQEWTIDKMSEMIDVVSNDTNGDGKFKLDEDVFGLAGRPYEFQPYFYTSGEEFTSWNEAEQRFVLNMNNERFIAIAETLGKFYDQSRSGIDYKDLAGGRTAFSNGNVLFYSYLLGDYVNLRENEDDYGIIGFPQYDYANEKSLHFIQNPNALYLPVVVGDDNGDGKPDYNEIGLFLQAVGAYTHDVTLDIYVSAAVIGKGTRDENSAKMVRHIMENRGYDIGQAYNFADSVNAGIYKAITKNESLISTYQSLNSKFEKLSENMVNDMAEAIEKQNEYK